MRVKSDMHVLAAWWLCSTCVESWLFRVVDSVRGGPPEPCRFSRRMRDLVALRCWRVILGAIIGS